MIVIELTTKFQKTDLWHNALPIGKFHHNLYGEIEITEDMVKQMAKNFKANIPHYKPPVNISHNDEKGAYGYVDEVEAREDGLWVHLVLTEEGAKLLEEQKFNYLSAEFTENYVDPKTGKNVGAVFLGVALTNRPAHPYMQPLKFGDIIGALKQTVVKLLSFVANDEVIELASMPLDDSSSWDWDWARDANAIIEKLGWSGLARACAYVKRENGKLPEKKENYKLPFAKLKNGKLTIYKSGVIAAMRALLGARGGVDIPADEKKTVYNKLARLYRLFDMTPPEFHNEQEVESMELEELKKSLEEAQKELEEKNKVIEELKAKLVEYELEAFKSKKVAEGYKPANVDKILEMVKAGKIDLEAADEMVNLTEKVELEQKYYATQLTNEEDVIKMAEEDAKRLGFKKEV